MIKRTVLLISAIALLLSVLPINAAGGFETNMSNWKGIESTWAQSQEGFKDGSEQTVFDFALSDTPVDGTKDFLYTVEFEKEDGYGAGMILGVKDGTNRTGISKAYIFFIADPANVYYSVFANNEVIAGPVGRPQTEDELAESKTILTAEFDSASGSVEFAINGNYVANYTETEAITGKLGLIAHDSSVYFKKANLALSEDTEETPFETNMAGWKGIESEWKETAKGYLDGSGQTIFDFAVSDVYVDGTKSFIYEAEIMRVNGYGFGLLFGVLNKESRNTILENHTLYIVDLKSVIYNRNQTENIARALTEEELDPGVADTTAESMVYKFTLEYDAEDEMATLFINDNYVGIIEDLDYIKGYLGLIAHDSNIRVLSAKYEEITTTPAPSKEATPANTPETTIKATATIKPSGDKDTNISPVLITAGIAGVVVVAVAVIVVILKRKRRI